MNSKHYDAWKKSRQIEASDFDITDAVMGRITRKTCKQSRLKSLSDIFSAGLIRAKSHVRICVLVSGALAGLLRMLFAFYYALFA